MSDTPLMRASERYAYGWQDVRAFTGVDVPTPQRDLYGFWELTIGRQWEPTERLMLAHKIGSLFAPAIARCWSGWRHR